LTSNFWRIYEMDFPEGADMKPPREIFLLLLEVLKLSSP
jgi:hypothetical protein